MRYWAKVVLVLSTESRCTRYIEHCDTADVMA